MAVKVGINGFGRIGRNIFRAALGDPAIEIVAVNDITDSKTLAHLLKYDSILGNLTHKVTHTDDTISVDGKSFKVFRVKDPAEIDWASVGAQIVVESTGLFTKGADARKHIRGPVKKVIISAPATDPDATIVLGVNDKTYDPAKHHVVSNASCTTNCLAPVAKVLQDTFRNHRGHHDHDPLLYERSEATRLAAQGSAPRARRGFVHDSDFDRRSEGAEPGDPRAEGQARWLRHARADAERKRGRSYRHRRKACDEWRA